MTLRTTRRRLASLVGTLLLGTGLVVVGSPVAAQAVVAPAIYSEPGSYQYTVPSGVTTLKAVVRGAQGGNYVNTGGGGGAGGLVSGIVKVSPGQVLWITVGGKGTGYYTDPGPFQANHHYTMGGFNGGGNGGVGFGAGGGGASDIRTFGSLASRILVGAGGGGGSFGIGGGNAGGFGGGRPGWCTEAPSPGMQTYGGAGLRCDRTTDGANGAFGRGGDGGVGSYGGAGGGGGGGGWYGGGGGGGGTVGRENTGGAGGSNYIAPSVTKIESGYAWTASGNGEVLITPNGR